jgi:hypothetical protein
MINAGIAIHPKALPSFGFECIGNIHTSYGTGLSKAAIEGILIQNNVASDVYAYVNNEFKMIQYHTAYDIAEAKEALTKTIESAVKVSKVFYKSPYYGSKFKLDQINAD